MSALSILYLVLPFPLLFVLHEAEEIMVQRRWLSTHRNALNAKFPRLRPLIDHLSRLTTPAFALAATEEWFILLAATCYVLVGGSYALPLWSALFIAFAFHQLVHIAQAVAVRGYVPGLVTSLLLLPYSALGLQSIWLVMSGWELLFWGIAGVAFMAINLRFAHGLGMKMSTKLSNKTHKGNNY